MNELLVGLFVLLFFAFCLTAIALYALSRDQDETAEDAIASITHLIKPPPPFDDDEAHRE